MPESDASTNAPAIVPEDERAAHLLAVRSRLAEGEEEVRRRAAAFEARNPTEARRRMLIQAAKSKTVAQRIHWLRREADLVVEAIAGLSPCSAGCTHCCHLGTLVTEHEAIVIGKAIGRAPADVPEELVMRASDAIEAGAARDLTMAKKTRVHDGYYGVPCPFLDGGRCSIYEDRPMSCRHLINVDVDDLLCRLVPGETITARYLNMRLQQAACLTVMGMNARIADIREWFPSLPPEGPRPA